MLAEANENERAGTSWTDSYPSAARHAPPRGRRPVAPSRTPGRASAPPARAQPRCRPARLAPTAQREPPSTVQPSPEAAVTARHPAWPPLSSGAISIPSSEIHPHKTRMNQDGGVRVRSILVFRAGQLGDTLILLPALSVIRRRHPEHPLILLTETQPAASGCVSS